MRYTGSFLCILRSNAGLSLDELAKIVGTSRSTISRLENDEYPQPFKGSIRKLIISLAEILCTSRKETERLLNLAGIERSLLPELEEAQLGFTPHIPEGSPDEKANLERLERLYEQLLKQLEGKETELGVSNAPPNLKLKIQEYTNILQEIRKRLDKLANRAELGEPLFIQAAPVYYVETLGERIVVGNHYGEEQDAVLKSNSLYTLASENARWLMQLADVERFAVDDCILLTNSDHFQGWEPHEIKTTILSTPFLSLQ